MIHTTFIGALRRSGMTDDARRADEQRCLPRLRRAGARSNAQARRCRLMDNLPAHKSAPISDALTRFSAEECANYFAAAGYAPT
jgi:hypothetical protein